MTSAAQIVRASGIGASEMAGVLDISPFSDPWRVYADKRGLRPPEPETGPMRCGKKFQRAIAEMFSEDTGLPHEWSDKPSFHPERPWQRASVDAFIPTIAAPEAVLEIKTSSLNHAGEWGPTYGRMGPENGPPLYYYVQLQYQLSVHDLSLGYMAVVIAGNDFRYYRIEANPEIQEFLVDEAEAFWRRHVLAGVEPPLGFSGAARAYLDGRYPRERERLRGARGKEIELLDEYARVRADLRPLEIQKEKLEFTLKQAVGDAEGLEWPGGKFTWKRAKDQQEVDWRKLAESQLLGYSDEERRALLEEHTQTEPGGRRIHFSPRREAA